MKFSDLPHTTASILRLCDEIGYGHLTNLDIIDGEIHTTNDTRKCPDVKLDKETTPPRASSQDYTLKDCQKNLVEQALSRKNSRITMLDIRDGLPVTAHFEEVVLAI